MARTQSRTKPPKTIEVIRHQIPEQLDDDEEIETPDFELNAAANELAGVDGASVTIYRQGQHGRDLKFVDTMPPVNFSMVMLKHPPYNGGIFRIQMRNARGEMVVNRRQEVEPGPKLPEPPAPPAQPAAQPAGVGNEAFVLLAKAMTDGFSRLGELIVAARPEPVKPRGTEEILNELTLMKTLFVQPSVSQADPIETMTKLLDLVGKFPGGGSDGGEPGPMAVLLELTRTFGPKLVEAQQQVEAERPALPMRGAPSRLRSIPAQPGQPVAPGQPVVVNPNQPSAERKPDVQFIITQQLMFLVRQAENKNDPEPYAVMVLDNVPPDVLAKFLDRPDWFDEVCRFVPAAQPHREWFDALKGYIDEYLTDDGGEDETGDTQSADGATHGHPSTGTAINGDPDTGGGTGDRGDA
jgi:hypothetical protein